LAKQGGGRRSDTTKLFRRTFIEIDLSSVFIDNASG